MGIIHTFASSLREDRRGQQSPLLLNKGMDRTHIRSLAEEGFTRPDLFLVSIDISPKNEITVTVDGMKPVALEDCIAISRSIEHQLDRDKEDFSLTVTSSGMGNPFVVWRQYEKNAGREVEVVSRDGAKQSGILHIKSEGIIELRWEEKVKIEGTKKKEIVERNRVYPLDEVASTRVIIQF